jgi:hypothetical protein
MAAVGASSREASPFEVQGRLQNLLTVPSLDLDCVWARSNPAPNSDPGPELLCSRPVNKITGTAEVVITRFHMTLIPSNGGPGSAYTVTRAP